MGRERFPLHLTGTGLRISETTILLVIRLNSSFSSKEMGQDGQERHQQKHSTINWSHQNRLLLLRTGWMTSNIYDLWSNLLSVGVIRNNNLEMDGNGSGSRVIAFILRDLPFTLHYNVLRVWEWDGVWEETTRDLQDWRLGYMFSLLTLVYCEIGDFFNYTHVTSQTRVNRRTTSMVNTLDLPVLYLFLVYKKIDTKIRLSKTHRVK